MLVAFSMYCIILYRILYILTVAIYYASNRQQEFCHILAIVCVVVQCSLSQLLFNILVLCQNTEQAML